MRTLLLLGIMCVTASLAFAAPNLGGKRSSPHVASVAAKPLSPKQLRGKVVYLLGSDVWSINPQTQHQQLLYRGLGAIAWSSSLSQVAFIGRAPGIPTLFVMNWDGSDKHQLPPPHYEPSDLRWSPDGKKLLYTNSDSLLKSPIQTVGFCVVDLEGKEPIYNSDTKTGNYLNPRWSRDGRRILANYLDYTNGVSEISELDKLPKKVLSLDGAPVEDFKFNWQDFILDNQSRDGKRRAEHTITSSWSPNIGLWQIEEETNANNVIWDEGDGFLVENVRFSEDVSHVAVEGRVIQWTADSQGVMHDNVLPGVWLITPSNQVKPTLRLLVKNARLLDWF